jgi:arabinose-5-phosphate isomerase
MLPKALASSAAPTSTPATRARSVSLGAQAVAVEAQALAALQRRIVGPMAEGFADAVHAMLACRGRVVVMGMGKSGHVARKIAATLASTGTPAMFVHPAEAGHGDLGMVTPQDMVLALSNSGEVDELTVLLPALKRLGVRVIAMTGRADSTLARHADHVLDSSVEQEACPLNLAPTASTTTQMALGDALAAAMLELRGFRADDFARSHPGGALGRKLLTLVRDVMRSGEAVPRVHASTSVIDAMREMSAKGIGCTAIVDGVDGGGPGLGTPLGIFTDGDLRRLVERGGDLRALSAGDAMHAHPRTVREDALAVDAADLMELAKINSVLVVDAQGSLVGAVTSNDLLRAKVI